MKSEKHDRTVEMQCPTCAGTTFEFDDGFADGVGSARCINCDRTFTKDDLIAENTENLTEHVKEMGRDIKADLVKELRASFRNATRGNKHVKFK